MTPTARPVADALLDRFEDDWQAGPPALDAYLPPPGDPDRPRVLVELIKIDLENRWRRGTADQPRPVLEDYAGRYPELGPPADLPADLIEEEYWARHCWGDRPPQADYRARFPGRTPAVVARLDRVDAELAAGRPDPPIPDVRPVPTPAELLAAVRALGLAPDEVLDELASTTDVRAAARELTDRQWLTPFQADRLLQGRSADLVLEPYLLLDRIGEGGAGEVYKARHRRTSRLAAVKVLRPELLADPDMVERFAREVRAAGRLDHPHVVRAYDAGRAGAALFIAMEYVDGIDLFRAIRRDGPLPPDRAADYARQAALGLAHAHERGLVHRDVKPHNLLLTGRAGTVKVADLGLARVAQTRDDSHLTAAATAAGTLLGTPDYMAPEQVDDAGTVDARADVYGLGATLYYLLTGRPPFPGGGLMQKLVKIKLSDPIPADEVRPEVPAGLAELVGRLMAKRPADRVPTAAEAAALLEPWVAGTGVNPRPRRRSRRRLWRRVGLAVALAVVAGAAGWAAFRPEAPRPEPAPIVFQVPREWYAGGRFPSAFPADGRPLWFLGCVWPARPDRADCYRFFPDRVDKPGGVLFDPDADSGGYVPAGQVYPDGSVRVNATAIKPVVPPHVPRDAVVGFIAPVDGAYRAAGRTKAKQWGGGGGPVRVVVARLDRRTGRVDDITGFAPGLGTGGAFEAGPAVPFEAGPVELAAGQFLVLRLTIDGYHGSVGCIFSDLTVTCRPARTPSEQR